MADGYERRLRVLHIAAALFGDEGVFGGGERFAFELARHMADEAPTTLLAFGARDRRERIGNLDLRILGNPWYIRGERSNPLKLSMISHVREADVIHCHQRHVLAASVAALAARVMRRRVFVTDLGGGGWDISAYLSTDRWFTGHLHLSEYSRKMSGHEARPFAHVILGGVDTEKFSPAATIRSNSVVYAGRILPHKGIDVLIEAMPHDLELRIVGRFIDPNYFADLERRASGRRVGFYRDCDDEGLIAQYRTALCVVLPSVYRDLYGAVTAVPELLGQTLLEAMACGTPVICTRVSSMPEIVEDGVSGFIVPPNDPAALRERIQWLRDHPAEALAMGAAARGRVLERFTWPQVVRRCLDIYRASGAEAIASRSL